MRKSGDFEALSRCTLFAGMYADEVSKALEFYSAKRASYLKGETLLSIGSAVERFAVVVSGSVQVMTDDIDGHHMIMATVEAGQTFGESLCLNHANEAPVYACAFTDCTVYWLKADMFDGSPALRFLKLITSKTLSMNERIQVLSKLTLRDKLTTLFNQLSQRDGNSFELPFDRESLAAYLGCNRSALSREMSNMKAEGLIDYHRSRITLLKQ